MTASPTLFFVRIYGIAGPERSYFLLAAVDEFPADNAGARPISPPENEFG